jgi:zinc protease
MVLRGSRRAAVVGLVLAAVGCVPRNRVDDSWAPVRAEVGPMARTLAPESDLGLELPRFAVAEEELPSGLKLGVETAPARGLSAVVLALGLGSSADPPGREGLAHLVEHLIYHARAAGQPSLADRLIRLGAQYNADTSLDLTKFYAVVPAASLPAALALTSEILTRPLAGVDEADFERERAIVGNELNERGELGVYGQILGWIQYVLYPPGDPHGRPIGGSAASLQTLTLAEARRFVAAHYRPAGATLLVSGEIEGREPLARVAARLPEALRARARSAAPVAAPAAPPSPAPAPPAPYRAWPAPPGGVPMLRIDYLQSAVANPEIWLAYDLGGGPAAATAVKKILVGAAAEDRFRERMLEEHDVMAVNFHPLDLGATSVLACEIVLDSPYRRDEIARVAERLLWTLWSERSLTADVAWEDWRAGTIVDLRRAALADTMLDAEPFLARTLERANLFQRTGAVDGYDRVLAAMAGVRPADVTGARDARLAPALVHTLFVDPLLVAGRPAAPPGEAHGAGNRPLASPELRAAEFPPPAPSEPPEGMSALRGFTLPCGLTVVLVPRHQFPSVTALLGFYGGAAALPPGLLALVRVIDPKSHDPGFSTALKIEDADGPGYSADLVHTDRRHLSNALYLLAGRVRAVAETNWGLLLDRARRRRDAIRHPPEEPRKRALAALAGALYGSHPYGRKLVAEQLLDLDGDDAAAWLPRLYNPTNGVLVIAGDFDPEAAARLAAGWFNGWVPPVRGRLAAPPVPPPAAQHRSEPAMLVTNRPVASQVEVTFGCRLAPVDGARAHAAEELLASLLGAYLFTEVREQEGAAYSVDSGVAALPGGGAHLAVSMSVDSRRLPETLRLLRRQLAGLASGRFDRAALSQARFGLMREAALRDQTGLEIAKDVFESIALGLGPNAMTDETTELLRVDDKDLARVFAPCMASPVVSLVGDEATIRAAR